MTPRPRAAAFVTSHTYRLPSGLPRGLTAAIELWLLDAVACCSPVRDRWPLCYALAQHADPDTLTVGTTREDWAQLRILGGLSWYWPSLATSCRHLATHGFLEPADEYRWKLTLPGRA